MRYTHPLAGKSSSYSGCGSCGSAGNVFVDHPISMTVDGEKYFYLYDGLGSVILGNQKFPNLSGFDQDDRGDRLKRGIDNMKWVKILPMMLVMLILFFNFTGVHSENTDQDYSSEIIKDQEPTLIPIWSEEISSDTSSALSPFLGSDGGIYVMEIGYNPTIYSLDKNGTLKWEFSEITKGHTVSKPVFGEEGNIYFLDKKGGERTCTISAIDSSGSLLWNEKIKNGSVRRDGPVLVEDAGIYIGSSDGYIHKYDLNGEKEFEKNLTDSRLTILGEMDDHLYLFESGEEEKRLIKTDLGADIVWEVEVNADYESFDFAVEDAIYLGLEEVNGYLPNKIIKVFEENGEERWTRKVSKDQELIYSLIHAHDNLYFISKDLNTTDSRSILFSLNPDDGENRWNFTFQHDSAGEMPGYLSVGETSFIYTFLSGSSYPRDIITDIYSFKQDGTLRYNISIKDKNLWRFCVNSQERFYTTTKDGNLTAFSLDKAPPTADAGENRKVDTDDIVTLDASSSEDDTGIVNYTWEIEGERYYNSTLNHSFSSTGSYNVTLTVTDGAGRQDNASVMIEVRSDDTPGFTLPLFISSIATTIIFYYNRINTSDHSEDEDC